MATVEPFASLRPGDRLDGGFVLRTLIGIGGAGFVYEAWEESLRRIVAVKLPRHETAAETLVTEAQALAAFRHPGLPTVYAIREHQGTPFLVLEMLRGNTLLNIVERHTSADPMPWREGVHYLVSIAEILQVLHRAQLVHRDVKPDNIMVCPSGRVVLLDLGIIQQERHFDGDHRRDGTPSYLAPEVISTSVGVGSGHFLDIYGLGVVAFELLTGDLPYGADTLEGLLHETVHAAVPRISDSREGVPGALDDLVHAMMAKEPFDRPDSVDAILHNLRAIIDGRILQNASQRLAVIMVDDDPDFLDLMRTCSDLLTRKIDLRLAADGETALAMLRERPCDLMVVDLELPGLNGIELCMYLRGMPEADETQVAIMSGKAKPEDKVLLSELGVIDFIEKSSLNLEDLVARLNQMLDRASAGRSAALSNETPR